MADQLFDERERTPIEDMTLEDKVNECLILMRGVEDAIQAISKNPTAFLTGMMG